jgi:hypothetical protein
VARGLAFLVLTVVVGAGCGYDDGKDLPAIVESATPREATRVGPCSGSSGLIESPSLGCTFVVRGAAGEVAASVARALAEDGFDVSCRRSAQVVELAGLRGDVRVSAEVIPAGSIVADDDLVNVHESGYVPPGARAIPRGSVALALTAARQSAASEDFQRGWVRHGFGCEPGELRERSPAGCVDAWNAQENERNRRRALRRMRVPVAYVSLRGDSPGVAQGCFFGFLARGGRYLMFESSWAGDRASFTAPELGYATGRGYDANARVREDGTLVLEPPSLNPRCGDWWNAAAGWDLRARALRLRLAGGVSAVYTPGEETRCDYVVRTRGGFFAGSVSFEHGRWATVQLERVDRPARFRPNGALAESGWMAVGP